jgi:hypothetical protein
VEGYRDKKGKVKQRIVQHIGVAQDEEEFKRLWDLGCAIKARIEAEDPSPSASDGRMALEAAQSRSDKFTTTKDALPIANLKALKEEQRVVVGIHEIYGKMYDELGFGRVFPESASYDSARRYLRHIVMARIADPQSKRQSVKLLKDDFDVELDLERVYRMMDKLNNRAVQRAQILALGAARGVLGGKIDVLFYDATTLYFESFTEDALKQKGYSKDGKFNQSQVLLALLVTPEGLPVGYEVFPGATYEGHTLVRVLERLQKHFQVNRVVFVADSGLLSETNLAVLEEKGYSYVVGARLRNTTNVVKKWIHDTSRYEAASEGDEEERLQCIQLSDTKRLIVHYSPKRAHKDASDRMEAVNQLLKKLRRSKNAESFLSNRGYKKYLKLSSQAGVALDEAKIEADSRWDGLRGVITNIAHLSPKQILEHYHGLWLIEETFRITKHDLKVRPIFHWTPNRIRAHIAIAFIALTCVRHLEYRLGLQKRLSPERIRNALFHVQISILKDCTTQKRYGIPSTPSLEAKEIYRAMALRLTTTPFLLS